MLYVSIFVELLRSRPSLAVWLAALTQALLWLLVPALFYAGPPGDLPDVLAVGHEFQLGTYLGPPLAFWLAEIAFDLAGHSLVGVYLLSQVCVVVTYWAVFALGRSIVGAQHAAMAVLLMVGVAAFTVPTPDFGPVILTMPLWAVILLHYWRAVGEDRRGYWLVLAIGQGAVSIFVVIASLVVIALFLRPPIDDLVLLAVVGSVLSVIATTGSTLTSRPTYDLIEAWHDDPNPSPGSTVTAWRAMRARILASGIRPRSAAMFSSMWSTRRVAGMAQVTAGCEMTNFKRNCAQFVQSMSAAQGGSG